VEGILRQTRAPFGLPVARRQGRAAERLDATQPDSVRGMQGLRWGLAQAVSRAVAKQTNP